MSIRFQNETQCSYLLLEEVESELEELVGEDIAELWVITNVDVPPAASPVVIEITEVTTGRDVVDVEELVDDDDVVVELEVDDVVVEVEVVDEDAVVELEVLVVLLDVVVCSSVVVVEELVDDVEVDVEEVLVSVVVEVEVAVVSGVVLVVDALDSKRPKENIAFSAEEIKDISTVITKRKEQRRGQLTQSLG